MLKEEQKMEGKGILLKLGEIVDKVKHQFIFMMLNLLKLTVRSTQFLL